MAARVALERGDWAAAAAFAAPDDRLAPAATMVARFTRAVGGPGSGRTPAGRKWPRWTRCPRSRGKGEPYWSRVAGIKRDAAGAWIRSQSGDTAGGLTLAAAAADSEDVTDKHPVTPAELLPARELEGDMLLTTGRVAEARESRIPRDPQAGAGPGPELVRRGARGGAGG